MDFPPRPRGDRRIRELAAAHLDRGAPAWHPVSCEGAARPWLGVACATDVGRPWVWDVVTPDTYDSVPGLRGDPMTLAVERDVVLCHLDAAGQELWMHVPVRSVPSQVHLPASAVPDGWAVTLESAWSREAVQGALDTWSLLERGATLDWGPRAPAPERFEIGDGLFVSGAAFDALLSCEAPTSAGAVEVLSAVVEALGDHVDRDAGRRRAGGA